MYEEEGQEGSRRRMAWGMRECLSRAAAPHGNVYWPGVVDRDERGAQCARSSRGNIGGVIKSKPRLGC